MEEMTLPKQGLSAAQQNMLAYFETHDPRYVAEDAVFINMGTGETYKGRAEIGAMLHYIYQVAFDAKVQPVDHVITEDKAMVQGFFKGKHIGEFAGIPATNNYVEVPMCVTYELKSGLIQKARIYFLTDVLLKQLGVSLSAAQPKTTFVTRDIFRLKFGHFKPAKDLLEEADRKGLLPDASNIRVLSDFTGDSYRLVFEEGYDSLAQYEQSLTGSMKQEEWQEWYARFKEHVESSHREILKQVF